MATHFFGKGSQQRETAFMELIFTVKNSLLKSLKDLNKCLNSLQLPTRNLHLATLISAYAATMNSIEEIKEQFCYDFCYIMKSISNEDPYFWETLMSELEKAVRLGGCNKEQCSWENEPASQQI